MRKPALSPAHMGTYDSLHKKCILPVTALVLAMTLWGCGNDSDKNSDGLDTHHEGTTKTISGVSQKGPFITGSSVTVQELDDNLLQTGKSFTGKIGNNRGEFSILSVPMESQYAWLAVNGFYRNEVTGKNSNSDITLNAIVDLSNRDNVNINLFTHLEADRVMHLVTNEHKKFSDAKKQAHDELLRYFGFAGNYGNSEDMNIFGNNADAAALLAMSVIVQGELSESEFSERLAIMANDLKDGSIDDNNIWIQMANWAIAADLDVIRQNMENWDENVPEFEKYVRVFSQETLLGKCTNIDEIKKYNDIEYICRENGWEKYSGYKTTCDDSLHQTNYFLTKPKEIVDYLVQICEISDIFQNEDFQSNKNEQKIGSACFCYGPSCEYAGYARPELQKSRVTIKDALGIERQVQAAAIYGCDAVPEDYQGAIRSCFRSSAFDGIEPAIYFPNGSCALAMSECLPSETCDPKDNDCLNAENQKEYASTLNENTICSFVRFGTYTGDFQTAANKFKKAGCPDKQVMLDYVMNIKLIMLKRSARLNVRGCFQGCETDADCHGYNVHDPSINEQSQLSCVVTKPDNATGRSAKVCFDKRSVEFTDAKDIIFVDTGDKVDSKYVVVP